MNHQRPDDAVLSSCPIYPKRYFDLSRTWFEWNKLSAAAIHALRDEPGFEGQQIAFHLNHPIRFVRVVGLVVATELTRGAKYTLITLDDGSGACIEVKVIARDAEPEEDAAQYPSNTLVDDIDVYVRLGLPCVQVRKQPIDVGTVLKVKARLDSFRGIRQLRAERVWVVTDTNAEARAWAETALWHREVLSKSWVLTSAQRDSADQQIQQAEAYERQRAKKKLEARSKYDEKRERHEQKREAKRMLEEQRMNAGALTGSHVIRSPWS